VDSIFIFDHRNLIVSIILNCHSTKDPFYSSFYGKFSLMILLSIFYLTYLDQQSNFYIIKILYFQ
jgi:hypothetical protein